jgi:tetratricopeptide (TPR) repeat protein
MLRALAGVARGVILTGPDRAVPALLFRSLREHGAGDTAAAVIARPGALPFRPGAFGLVLVALDPPGGAGVTGSLKEAAGGAPILAVGSRRQVAPGATVLAAAAGRALFVLATAGGRAPEDRPPIFAAPRRRVAPVTVIIPTRDRAAFLSCAIDSVRAQDRAAEEILVVDDGSRDSTPALLAGMQGSVRVLQLDQSRGQGAAMNAGIAAAKSDWIAWLDDDDTFLPAKLRLQLASLRDPGVGLLVTAHYIADAAGRPLETRLLPEFSEHEVLRLLLRGSIFLGPTALVRRAAYLELGSTPYDETLPRAADYAMWWRLARRWRVAVLQVPLTVVRRHPGNALDVGRARLIYQSVRRTLRWVQAEVPLAEIAGDGASAEVHTEVCFERARALFRAGLLAEARVDLEPLRARDPERAENLLGLAALADRDHAAAAALFTGVLRRFPRSQEAANGLATAYLHLKQRAAAAAILTTALGHFPGDPLTRYNLALAAEADPEHPGPALTLARDLLAERGVRCAHFSPAPPLRGLDAHFAFLRGEPPPD